MQLIPIKLGLLKSLHIKLQLLVCTESYYNKWKELFVKKKSICVHVLSCAWLNQCFSTYMNYITVNIRLHLKTNAL